MISDKLRQARQYEKEMGEKIPDGDRPVYHLTPWTGWMNDPNGFSFYKGKYHLFYQYYPYATEWGPMHWGHVVSEDLIHWDYLPAALAPDQSYDVEGCWSGSAIELPDGRQLLLYTGREPFINEGRHEIRQVQCAAVGDGSDYEKYPGNPVLSSGDLPEGAGIYDFRDPKIWKDEQTDIYYMVIGSRAQDGFGQVLLYSSEDGIAWKYVRVLGASHGEVGSMWECPDFFEMDGRAFLLISPQDMKQEGEFLNRHGNAYLAGSYDHETHEFTREDLHALDFGYDFYAAQTLKAPDGRRILIAWMQAWENARGREFPYGWAGMMTIPRELSVRNGCLIQNPIKELEKIRSHPVTCRKVPVSGRIRLEGVQGRCIDMTVEVGAGWNSDYDSFEIRFAEGEIRGRYYAVILSYDKKEGLITLDRSVSGYPDDALGLRRILMRDKADSGSESGRPAVKAGEVENRASNIRFRILLDRFSAEIFINDGRYTMSSVITTPEEANGISFVAEGDAIINIDKYELDKYELKNLS